jgi:hypothetical protein
MTQRTETAGQTFTSEIRTMFSIGPRTRWYRKGGALVQLTRNEIIREVFEAIGNYRGSESTERTAILDSAYRPLLAWIKHIDGARVDAALVMAVAVDSSPWEWTAYIGRMVDSDCANAGQFEAWFNREARELRAQRAAA